MATTKAQRQSQILDTMIVQDDTIVITDPCYIMKEEHWEQYLSQGISNSVDCTSLKRYLRSHFNFGEVLAGDTVYGDWSNEIIDSETNEVIGEFSADAGMLIACTASDFDNYGYDRDEVEKLRQNGCLATIENFEGRIDYVLETEGEDFAMAVLIGYDKDGNEIFHTQHLVTEWD